MWSSATYWRLGIALALSLLLFSASSVSAETAHKVYFKGTDSALDVYTISGSSPGPTLLLLGGIQGDEPGGYLAADLYADISLKVGNLIVVPRANFLSIVENTRGVEGDMNRKFAGRIEPSDRELAIVGIIKELMKKSDYFLNLHDGSGFYSPQWESPVRNPMRFGQSIIADADQFARSDGKVIQMEATVQRVLEKANRQIIPHNHQFRFNNHRTLCKDTVHMEQRKSATYHALTQLGIPAFGIETSKNIADYRLRVRYQTMVVNAFLEEFGIIPENPKIYLENPQLRYLIVSINGGTPIVVTGQDSIKAHKGDTVRIIHLEANYPRGLTARIKGSTRRLNDLDQEVVVTENSQIEIRKDRFHVVDIPLEIIPDSSPVSAGIHFEPRVRYFCVRINDTTYMIEPGEHLQVTRGDTVVIQDPQTNLDKETEKAVRVDLRGFQATSSPYPMEDRGHRINTATDLQEKFGLKKGPATVFALQAKLNTKVVGESYIDIMEPRLEYFVLKESQGGTFVAYPEDRLELPENLVVKVLDIRINVPGSSQLFLTMSGKSVRWEQTGSTGIDASKLSEAETPLDVTRNGRSLGRIWIKKGKAFRVYSRGDKPYVPVSRARY